MVGWQQGVVFLAAIAAGAINSVAGGGTLITFPTLLWLGRNPIIANASNAMGVWPGSVTGALGFRRELYQSRRWATIFAIPSLLGAVAGAVLLTKTRTSTFEVLVPWLILGATLLLAAQEPISRMVRRDTGADGSPSRGWWAGAIAFEFLVAGYGGYFGAGQGILLLAALGILGMTDIHQMNGVKNFLTVLINGVAALYFAFKGLINWVDAGIIAVGAGAGAFAGAGIARRLGQAFVKRTVVAIGVVMSLSMFLRLRH